MESSKSNEAEEAEPAAEYVDKNISPGQSDNSDDSGGGSEAEGTDDDGRIDCDGEYAEGMMTLEEHLDELRSTLIRIIAVVAVFACAAFAWKDTMFDIIFAPAESDFLLYRRINRAVDAIGLHSMRLGDFSVQLINTELSSQFMTHISMSLYFGLLMASPYVVYRLFCFIRPALYEQERRHSTAIVTAIYMLFAAGLAMNYFVIFPISFRFLGTYQVSEIVTNTIALSSYISSFVLLSLMSGLIFEIPVLALLLGRTGLITAAMLAKYRKPAFVVIMIISALITPPDIFTLLLMTIPLYGLYEISIRILRRYE